MTSTGSSSLKLMTSAPCARHLQARLFLVHREDTPGAQNLRAGDGELSDWSAAEDRDRVAVGDLGDLRSKVSGREDVGDHNRLLVGDLMGQLYEVDGGIRDSRELGLQPVERPRGLRPAEERGPGLWSVGVDIVALGIVPGPAVRAVTTAEGRGDNYSVAYPQVPDLGADLLDDTDALMAEDRTRLHPRQCATDHVQVRPADRAGCQPHNGIRWFLYLRFLDIVEPYISYAVENDRFH